MVLLSPQEDVCIHFCFDSLLISQVICIFFFLKRFCGVFPLILWFLQKYSSCCQIMKVRLSSLVWNRHFIQLLSPHGLFCHIDSKFQWQWDSFITSLCPCWPIVCFKQWAVLSKTSFSWASGTSLLFCWVFRSLCNRLLNLLPYKIYSDSLSTRLKKPNLSWRSWQLCCHPGWSQLVRLQTKSRIEKLGKGRKQFYPLRCRWVIRDLDPRWVLLNIQLLSQLRTTCVNPVWL